jgi:CRISPR-associated protein Cas1
MPQVLPNTLFLLTPKLSVRRDGLALRIEENGKLKLSLPVHNLDSIFVFAPDIYVSPSAMRLCWENRAAIAYFTENGRLEARVEGVPQGSVLLRRAQHTAASAEIPSARIARAFVAGKIHNTRWLVSRTARETESDVDKAVLEQLAAELAALIRILPTLQTVDEIRGIEGRAAALYFALFSLHLRPNLREKFPVDGRNRRPPRDAVNCLLSFLYALLRHACVSALTSVGLDPFVGYLHVDRPGRESLALDLMEEFRPWAERLAITLLNRGELKLASFIQREGGAVELAEHARKAIVEAWQERRREKIAHPLYQGKVEHRQLPVLQACLLAKTIREDGDYTPFLFT